MNSPDSIAPDTQLQRLVLLIETGALDQAVQVAETADPQVRSSSEFLRIHAIALHQLGRSQEAMHLLHEAAAIEPANIKVQCNLASLELDAGRVDEAIERLRAALRSSPGNSAVLLVLGNALMAAARYSNARESYSMATHGAPDHPGIRLNLAAAELKLGHPDRCLVHANEAVAISPQMAAAHSIRGHAHRALGQPVDALHAFIRAAELEPKACEHPYHAGQMFDQIGQPSDAASTYAHVLRIDPAHGGALSQRLFTLRRLCRWEELQPLIPQLRQAVNEGAAEIGPFGVLAEDFSAAEQRKCSETFATAIEQKMAPLRHQLDFSHPPRAAGAPLRIGMVSDGFGEHPTALLIVAMIEAMRFDDIELHLYATVASDGGPIRKRLEAACQVHPFEGPGTAGLAQRIHADGIEILIDLAVYCEGSNAELFALCPAPVQVNWLGYPGTSGAAWMHYLLGDATVVPDDARDEISEKLVRLPRCFQPSDTTRVIPAAPSRENCGLPATGTVFACFNASYKINPASFSRFMRILEGTPGSVLWLLTGYEGTDTRLREQAALCGIDPQRLVFLGRLPHDEYLARLRVADLFLDTLPYNAHTTASDALWAACPLLTCAGNTFAGRVAASVLAHAGMSELIAPDEEAFVAMAIQLGNDPDLLSRLRDALQAQQDSAEHFDMSAYAADFRRAMLAMAARHRIGLQPADIDL